jgi:hypothetical protein
MISNNHHIHGCTHTHTHTNTLKHTHTQTQIYTHVLKKLTKKKMNEAMKREHAITEKITVCLKGKNEMNMPLLEESRPQISPAKKAPASMQTPNSENQTKP